MSTGIPFGFFGSFGKDKTTIVVDVLTRTIVAFEAFEKVEAVVQMFVDANGPIDRLEVEHRIEQRLRKLSAQQDPEVGFSGAWELD